GVQYNGTGTLGTANGGYFQNVNNSTGTITTSKGIYINNPLNSGTITTNYGLYIASQSAGITNYGLYLSGSANYGVYSNGGTNYFAGNVGIGTNNPSKMLDLYFNNQNSSTSQMLREQAGSGNSWMNIGMTGGNTYALGVDHSD